MKMEKNILPFIELEDIASFNYPVYAHMKEKDGITIYETLEEHTNRCKYYFKRIFYQKELDCVVRRFSEALEFKNKKAVYRWMIKLLWQMIIFHDIGKCNPNFQRKKMKNNDDSIPESLKGLSGIEHSFLSSILYLDYFFDLLEKEEAFEMDDTMEYSYVTEMTDRLVLETAMNILTERERQILLLHLVAGIRHREIAANLGLPLSTVLSCYQRTLKKLKRYLEGKE